MKKVIGHILMSIPWVVIIVVLGITIAVLIKETPEFMAFLGIGIGITIVLRILYVLGDYLVNG